LNGHLGEVRCCVLYGTYKLISSGGDKSIKFWDLTTNECVRSMLGHSNVVTCLKLIENEQILLSGSFDGTIKVWELPKGDCLFTINAHSDWIMRFEQLINGYLIIYIKFKINLPVFF
jgi:WD40 repeat protein